MLLSDRVEALETRWAPVEIDAPRMEQSGERLDSWKEIAAYLKRGARTVQRWEREEGLPVHRLAARDARLGVRVPGGARPLVGAAQRGAAPQEPAAEPSVAVLPFADMSRERDQAYFCEGIAEEITNALSRVEGLRVASRTSAFHFRPGTADSREISRRLHVRTLLEGSVRKSGDRLRIAVQLGDAQTGYQLWAAPLRPRDARHLRRPGRDRAGRGRARCAWP